MSGIPVAILSLDQEKAFDRVDWGFLRSTLVRMGFGSSFIGWVDLFYTGVQSAVKLNCYRSSFFCLSRGVRQGCPLSPLSYVLYAEVLACNILLIVVLLVCLFLVVSLLYLLSQNMLMILLLLWFLMTLLKLFLTLILYLNLDLVVGKLNLSKSKGLWLSLIHI